MQYGQALRCYLGASACACGRYRLNGDDNVQLVSRYESYQNSHGTEKRTEDVLLFIFPSRFVVQPAAPIAGIVSLPSLLHPLNALRTGDSPVGGLFGSSRD